MEIVILTGMSGAGKSTSLKIMEDAGYFCIDNLPISLIEKLAELTASRSREEARVVLGVDVRSGNFVTELEVALERLSSMGYAYKILYLESDDEVLVKRYKETRRMHPLAKGGRVEEGIRQEREMLKPLKEKADYILDTSHLLTRELNEQLRKIFVEKKDYKSLYITILSFGFKYGIPQDADLVFDVRFLPNPYYDQNLRPFTGNDAPVRDFVMKGGAADTFLEKVGDLLSFLLPNYISEGKTQLVIAVGCTGGKHRSVTLANALYEMLDKSNDYGIRIEHRDIVRDAQRGK